MNLLMNQTYTVRETSFQGFWPEYWKGGAAIYWDGGDWEGVEGNIIHAKEWMSNSSSHSDSSQFACLKMHESLIRITLKSRDKFEDKNYYENEHLFPWRYFQQGLRSSPDVTKLSCLNSSSQAKSGAEFFLLLAYLYSTFISQVFCGYFQICLISVSVVFDTVSFKTSNFLFSWLRVI